MDQPRTVGPYDGSSVRGYLIGREGSRARIVDSGPSRQPVVTVGSTVLVEDEATGKTATYQVVGPHPSLENDAVSTVSPVGRAPDAQPEDGSVTVVIPSGPSRTLRLARLEATADGGIRQDPATTWTGSCASRGSRMRPGTHSTGR